MRRSIVLFSVLLLLSVIAENTRGQVQYTVTSLNDNTSSGTLRWAITQANQQSAPVTINFNVAGGGTLSLAALGMLPVLTNNSGITIDGSNSGQGAITIDGGSVDRMFFVGLSSDTPLTASWSPTPASTQFTIENLTLQNGMACGGNGGMGGGGGGAGFGGAIFVNAGQLNLSNVSFVKNSAIGGNGGVAASNNYQSGGGGMGGTGGSGYITGAGGGGIGRNAYAPGGAGNFTNGTYGGLPGGNGYLESGGPNGGGGGCGYTQGTFAGGGGIGGTTTGPGGFGGGGSSWQSGGYGGGGGEGAAGGFGGGGGGDGGSPGSGGFGGGTGSSGTNAGGGGAGLGGAIFVRQGASLSVNGGSFSGDTVSGGMGSNNGQGIGQAVFLAGSMTYNVNLGSSITADSIGGGVDAQITGGFVKTGGGTLTLASANYTGGTTVAAGVLQFGNGAAWADVPHYQTGNISVAANATFKFNCGSPGIYTGQLSGNGSLYVTGNGSSEFYGSNSAFSGSVIVDGTELCSGNQNAFGTQTSLSLANGAGVSVYNYDTSDDIVVGSLASSDSSTWVRLGRGNGLTVGYNNTNTTFAGMIITDQTDKRGFVNKVGSGMLTLSGNNTYSCGTTISGGTLEIGNGSSGEYLASPTVASSGVVAFDHNDNLTYSGGISGPGSVAKLGVGCLILTGSSTYSGGTTIGSGILQLGDGALNNGSITGSVTNNAAMVFANPVAQTLNLAISGSGSLTKNSAAVLTLAGSSNYSGGTNINQGTLNVTGSLAGGGNVILASNATLSGSGLILGNISGAVASTIAASGNLVLGDSTSYAGFNYAGTLAVGPNTVTLNAAGFANLGTLTTLAGGTLVAPNGVSLGVGCNLVGSGAVNGKIAAGYGSTINATGNLTLGDSNSYVGFYSDGELYTNSYTVTLNSKNTAGNTNAVDLGSLTEIEGGALVAPSGFLLASGKSLVSNGGGIVSNLSAGTASRFLNQGYVQGPAATSSNWLVFTLPFKGSTGLTGGNVGFLGGFSPGNSPGVNNHNGNALVGGSSNEYDIGGPTPGNTDSNYSQLNATGSVTIYPGATLEVAMWNGFLPSHNEQFALITGASLSGTFTTITGLNLGSRLQLVPQYTGQDLILTAVQGGSGSWAADAGGSVSTATNWATAMPGAAGDAATFGPIISQPHTINVDAPTTFGSMVFQSTAGYSLTASGTNGLTLDNSDSAATINVLAGSHSVNAPVTLRSSLAVTAANGTGLTLSGPIGESSPGQSISLSGGGLLTLGGANTYTGTTTVSGGTLQVTGSLANNGSNKVLVAKDADGILGNGTGDASIIRRVGVGGTYAGMGSSITNLGTGELPTTADILDGNASAQADVSMAWRTRTEAEKTRAGGGLISEIVDVKGMVLSGGGIHDGSSQTDMFVLQMGYDPTQLLSIWGLTEPQAVALDMLHLGYRDLGPDGVVGTADDRWINAVCGNFGGTPNFVGDQPYNSSYFVLGDYGVDTANHVVWAVVNHNSEFGVVPEPSTLVLLGVGVIVLLAWKRRRRQSH